MAPRLLFFILTGLIAYPSLALYHGHQAKKLADMSRSDTIDTAASYDREKSWIQVSTEPEGFVTPDKPAHVDNGEQDRAEQTADDRFLSAPPGAGGSSAAAVHAVRIDPRGQPLPQVREDPAELRSALEREKMKADNLAREKERLLFRVDALQTELREVRSRLQEVEGKPQLSAAASEQNVMPTRIGGEAAGSAAEDTRIGPGQQSGSAITDALNNANEKIDVLSQQLRQAAVRIADAEKTIEELNTSLAIERKNSQDALDTARDELTRSRRECEQYLVEIGRLETMLGKTKSRLVDAESEINRSRLQAEAMLYYGREQDRLLMPFRQEIESLHARLEDMNSSLARSERQVADLRAAEKKLRLQIDGQRTDEDDVSPID
jgi:DNA repair exonuclease SbcCD ATPase subunit